MVCLDTDIIIDFLKKRDYAVKKIKNLQDKEIKLSTTTVNTFELFKGAEKSGNLEAFNTLNQIFSNISIYDFNFESSKKAAEIFEKLKSKGELLDLADIMIAAIAITNSEILLTRNTKHFNRISELKIEKAD